jgi:DNA polymerase-3 subunit alpha (Gram-positive type)
MGEESIENNKKKVSELEQLIQQKEGEIKALWEAMRDEKERPKEGIIEELKGIKRTTGQHPGGLLITLPNTDIQKYTPLNYPADNRQSE